MNCWPFTGLPTRTCCTTMRQGKAIHVMVSLEAITGAPAQSHHTSTFANSWRDTMTENNHIKPSCLPTAGGISLSENTSMMMCTSWYLLRLQSFLPGQGR